MLEEVAIRNLRRRLPLRADRLRGTIGDHYIVGSDSNKVAVTDHGHAWNFLRLRRVAKSQLRVKSVRANDFAVEHSRQTEIGSVFVGAGDEVPAVFFRSRSAGDLPVGCRGEIGIIWKNRGQLLAMHQFAIG